VPPHVRAALPAERKKPGLHNVEATLLKFCEFVYEYVAAFVTVVSAVHVMTEQVGAVPFQLGGINHGKEVPSQMRLALPADMKKPELHDVLATLSIS